MAAVHRQLVGEPAFRYRAYENFLKAEVCRSKQQSRHPTARNGTQDCAIKNRHSRC